jgi:hypothetical protein
MKQKWRTKRLLALALLLASVLGLAWGSQITSVSVAGTEPEVTPAEAIQSGPLVIGSSVVFASPSVDGIDYYMKSGMHIFRIDLRADLRFETVIADDDTNAKHTHKLEFVWEMVDRDPYRDAVLAVNTDYWGRGEDCPTSATHGVEGLAVKNGERLDNLYDIGNNPDSRSSLAIASWDYESGARGVEIDRSDHGGDWGHWYNVVGGGPQIVRNGNVVPIDQACDEENFEDYWCRPYGTASPARHPVVGITEDGNELILVVCPYNAEVDDVSRILASEGAWTGMKFDGGGSTQLWYESDPPLVDTCRPVVEALLVFPRIPAPSDLSAGDESSSQIDLQWSYGGEYVSSFYIERRPGSSGSWEEIAEVNGDERNYSDIGLDEETEYCYRIRAYRSHTVDGMGGDISEYSKYSGEACATTQPKPNQPPTKPTLISPPNDGWINDNTPTLDWEFNDPDDDPQGWYHVQVDDENGFNSPRIWERDEDSSDTHVTVGSALSDGAYYWRVETKDPDWEESGWSDTWSFHLDTSPPDTTITEGPSGPITTNDVTFLWTGSDDRTAVGDLKYRYRLRGLSDNWSDWTSGTSKSYTDLPDRDGYTFEVKARDKASNEDPIPASRGFDVDTTPPETAITSGPSGCIGTADVTFTWTGSDNRTPTAELLYSYKLGGFDANWSAWTGDTSKSYTGLPDGDYTFKVKAKDGVGHEDLSPAARSFRVDTMPPTGSVLINGGDSTTNKIAVHLDITGDDGPVGCGVTEMRLSNDGFNWEAWESFATEGEWLLPTLNRTTWTVHLQLKDLVGNVSEAFTDDIYLDLYPPRPSSENYQLGARVVASGDPTSISESYGLLSATMGQPIADGGLQGAAYRLESGYQGAWLSVPRGRPPAESYDIKTSLVASGGGYQVSENYRLQSAAGQSTDVGPRSSANYQLLSGYLPCKLIGDLNVNGQVDVADIMMVASRWRCQSGDDCYHERCDLDKDGDIDVVDIMKVSAHWGESCP